MNWNTGLDEDFEDINELTYDFDAKDIHLKTEEFVKIKSLKQLRPLYDKQPWGIFFVDFESKRFEISSLRKILSGLIPKRKNRNNKVWDKKNLLFFCFWGEAKNRTFGAVHFEDKSHSGNVNALPSIKTIHVAPKNEDAIQLQNFEEKFTKLSFPDLPVKPSAEDFNKWTENWISAFTHVYRQVIYDSNLLTSNLAEIALSIRRNILDIFSVETENGEIHQLYNKFRKTLIHDMTKEQFADMYAQTMVYGLFSARCMSDRFEKPDRYSDNKIFDPREAIDNIPSTNPFLQNLLKESFTRKNKLSFDELDLCDIADLLQNTDTKSIIDDFNRQTGGGKEDPVIYFYEGFLNAYEKEQKKRRGVYYTPLPVVKFMVQAVDDILKNEFGIKDGFASTVTKTISIPKKDGGKVIAAEKKEVPAIQILDPAVGTATFLRQVVLKIWDNFKNSRKGLLSEGKLTKNSIRNQWNVYVKEHLLPRLNGFELMMAPYAVAHMKLALVLLDTEYAFDEDEENPSRVKVFLTNSLEEADREEGQGMMFEHDALAEESNAARETKKNRGINVVIGNPPYSVVSANKGDWINILLEDYKKEPGGLEKLKEKNPKIINDDYVKFIRYAQYYVERAGSGIVAYINNHSFINNITFRGMRWNILKNFNKIYIIDLHGNSKKEETTPNGSKDENVFDIQQGVSINIFIKNENKNTELAELFHYDLYGLRDEKYNFLLNQNIYTIDWNNPVPTEPQYFFIKKYFINQMQYEKGFSVTDIFIIKAPGVKTAGDEIYINKNKKILKENIFSNFGKLKNEKDIIKYSYRPFDIQYIYYDIEKLGRPREKIMQHLINEKNIGLSAARQCITDWRYVFITKYVSDNNLTGTAGSFGTGNIFPLYLYKGKKRRPNLNPTIINEIEQKLNLSFVPEKEDSKNTFSPIDLFDYIYAVLYSPLYRETYREFLKIDFPRIPYPADQQSFRKLAVLGEKLRKLHLLEGVDFKEIEEASESSEKVKIDKIRYEDGKVYVNKDYCFENVSRTAWEFYIGGYQPAQKWLKDRKGSILKADDIRHYRKIVLALSKTAEVMGEIDGVAMIKIINTKEEEK